jgi:hypothetical protein
MFGRSQAAEIALQLRKNSILLASDQQPVKACIFHRAVSQNFATLKNENCRDLLKAD